MIKKFSKSALTFLLYIFNNIFKEGTFPRKCKKAVVLPFPKSGKNAQLPCNYRPIALTSCVSKLLEKILYFRLMYILELKNFLVHFSMGSERTEAL